MALDAKNLSGKGFPEVSVLAHNLDGESRNTDCIGFSISTLLKFCQEPINEVTVCHIVFQLVDRL